MAVWLRGAAVLLGVQRGTVPSISRQGDRNRGYDGNFGENGWAGGEGGWPGEWKGEGGGGPAWHVSDPFIFKLFQVKLNDFFSLWRTEIKRCQVY